MSKISDLNEKEIIEKYFNRSKNLPDQCRGIGDDCAAYKSDPASAEWQLVTTDALVEGTHFIMDRIDPGDLGYKSIAVNLSDIAAMGGTPTGAYISVALPDELRTGWMDKFSDGIFEVCDRWQIPVLGGDTIVSSHKFYISMTITGQVSDARIRYRKGAEEGDVICVTGPLGDSAAGLRIILEVGSAMDSLDRTVRKRLVQKHYRPPINLDLGNWLGDRDEVKALMDISDGISSDLPEMMKYNSLGANIVREDIPLSDEIKVFEDQTPFSAFLLAEDGGEDYHLLLAVDASGVDALKRDFEAAFGRPFNTIGTFTDQHRDLLIFQEEQRVRKNPASFQQFAG